MSRKRRKKPLDRGIADIGDLASNARGVGRDAQGKAVFVADTLPGERAVYRPTRRKRGMDEAEMATLLSSSPARVTPRCKHFGVCGGCILQHAGDDAQIGFKQGQLLAGLARIGKLEPEQVLDAVTDARWGYRRRARLGVKYVPKKGGALVGFRERGAPYIAVLERCEVLVEAVGSRLGELARMIDTLSIRARIPQIEVAAADNAIALVFRVLDEPDAEDRARLAAFGASQGFSIYLQPGNEDTIAALAPDAPELYYALPRYDARLVFKPNDFVQIHAGINSKMVDQALELLAPQPRDTVLELFAGLGNFSVPLSRYARRVVTVEGEAALVERARYNAKLNRASNIEAHAANLFEPGATPAWLAHGADKVLLDPPRSGAAEVLDQVAATGATRIVYCSCHPATLARDAAELVHRHGYRLTHAGVMDMFPHTAHIESMAVFEAAS